MNRWSPLVIIFVTLASAADAAVVYLKDGSQYKGTVVSATAGDIQLQTEDGVVPIKTSRIDRIDYSESATPTPKPAPAATPAPAAVTPPAASAPASPTPVELRRSPEYRYYYERATPGSLRQSFSLGFGAAVPLSRVDFGPAGGGTDDNGSAGFAIGGRYLVGLDPRLGLGVDVEYFNRSRTQSQSLLPESNTDVFGDSLLFLATAKYSLISSGFARPYFLGGIGTNRTSTVAEASPNIGFGWSDTDTAETRTLVDQAHWGFASRLGFGVDFTIDEPSFFGLEFAWTRLSNATYGVTRAGQDVGLDPLTGNQNVLTIMGRWGWRF